MREKILLVSFVPDQRPAIRHREEREVAFGFLVEGLCFCAIKKEFCGYHCAESAHRA